MGKTSAAATQRYQKKTYSDLKVKLSEADKEILNAYCENAKISMSDFTYCLLIKELAKNGVRLQGTATRDVDGIIASDTPTATDDLEQ